MNHNTGRNNHKVFVWPCCTALFKNDLKLGWAIYWFYFINVVWDYILSLIWDIVIFWYSIIDIHFHVFLWFLLFRFICSFVPMCQVFFVFISSFCVNPGPFFCVYLCPVNQSALVCICSLCAPCCLCQLILYCSPELVPVSPRGMFLSFCSSCFYWFVLCFLLYFIKPFSFW